MKTRTQELHRLLTCLFKERFGDLTEDDHQFLEGWRKKSFENEDFYQEWQTPGRLEAWLVEQQQFDADAALERFKALRPPLTPTASQPSRNPTRNRMLRRWVYIAAAVILWICIAVWMRTSVNTLEQIHSDGHGAFLTLLDGRVVELNTNQEGIVMAEKLTYLDGSLVDVDSDEYKQNAESELVLHIPKGKSYRVTLMDGTKIWLNSGSTLRYPALFLKDQERSVRLDGEAFFEVNQKVHSERVDQKLPFKVHTKNQVIEVLGTRFNVFAFDDEPISQTTLVEGRVRVFTESKSQDTGFDSRGVLLQSGQQATLYPGAESGLIVQYVDVDGFTGWQAGLLVFPDLSIDAAIRKIERTYDVIFDVQVKIPDQRVNGEFRNTAPLSEILDALAKITGLNFTIKGERRVVVSI